MLLQHATLFIITFYCPFNAKKVYLHMHKEIIRREVPVDVPLLPDTPAFLSRIYASRGVTDASELALVLRHLAPSDTFKDINQAVAVIASCVMSGQKIIVVGDFDADGATSTTLAVEALTAMGAQSCDYLVPDRFKFGYGLTPEIVELAAQQNPDLIITVDNGVSSFEGVALAKSLGIQVVVTDHHLPAEHLPDADAIVNPAQSDCGFLSKNLAGVGVIFYVLSALRSRLRQLNWFENQGIAEPNLADYLDLVALGTVADLVPLDYNNRILVEQGIRRIRAGRARPGILALFEVAGREYKNAVASDMGFVVGPRLNAAGRLNDMSLGIECLRSHDMLDAKQRAFELHSLNSERRQIEDEMRRDAEASLAAIDTEEEDRWGVVLFEPHWHQGVIGILASRVKEKLHRPVIAFAPESDDPENTEFLKGSARSIPGLHMRDALDLIAKRHPEILQKFGGHAMAAGMTLRYEHLAQFASAFDAIVRELLVASDLQAVLYSDGELAAQDLTERNVDLLQRAGPWGQQFPEPAFDGVAIVASQRVLKDKHLKLVLDFGGGQLFDAIQFSSPFVAEGLAGSLKQVRVLYRPSINEFRGRRSVQLMIDYMEPVHA